MTAAKHSDSSSFDRPLLSDPSPSHPQTPQYIVVLPPYIPPYRINRLLHKSCQHRLICSAVPLLILTAAAYILWPSDPKLSVIRISLNRLHFYTTPKISLDVALDLALKVWNKDFYSIDYVSLDVGIRYRGRRLGFITSDGGRVSAWHASYVNAMLQLDGAEVLSDVILLLEDLARGAINSTRIQRLLGILGFSFSTCLLRLMVAGSGNLQTDGSTNAIEESTVELTEKKKLKKQTFRVTSKVAEKIEGPAMPFSEEYLSDAKRKLTEHNKRDAERSRTAELKNNL